MRTEFGSLDIVAAKCVLGLIPGEALQKKRIQVEGVSARTIALGQIRGTPPSLLLEKRGVSLDDVAEKVAAALARVGGVDPWRGPANAVVVEARAEA